MNYIVQSFKTRSYWKYALLSQDSVKTLLASIGGIWTIIEFADYFGIVSKPASPKLIFGGILLASIVIVIITRRPLTKIKYNVHGMDLCIEVRVGNLFNVRGQKVISSNTTFDTSLGDGIISINSVQGQFTNLYYPQNVSKLDNELNMALALQEHHEIDKPAGKNLKYPMGTTITLNQGKEVFYMFAMSDMNASNVAVTSLEIVKVALVKLWEHISAKGERDDIVIPLVGTGLGRIPTKRKTVIAEIASSFVNASAERVFSNRLIIMIHPSDVKNFEINLFEVKDLLTHILP